MSSTQIYLIALQDILNVRNMGTGHVKDHVQYNQNQKGPD